MHLSLFLHFFFFNDTATTEIYTLSLHDALPISRPQGNRDGPAHRTGVPVPGAGLRRIVLPEGCQGADPHGGRSEEHTSELQSRPHLVCRLLLEKKKKQARTTP